MKRPLRVHGGDGAALYHVGAPVGPVVTAVTFSALSDADLSGFVAGVAAEAERSGFEDVAVALREAAVRLLRVADRPPPDFTIHDS